MITWVKDVGLIPASWARPPSWPDGERPVAFGRSGAVAESDLVAVGVGECGCPTERAVDRCGDDRVTGRDEGIVNGLDVCGVQPDRGRLCAFADPIRT